MSEFTVLDFIWGLTEDDSDYRIDHVWERHGLRPEEVEDVLYDDAPRHWPNPGDHPAHRRMVVGTTRGGTYLQVVVEMIGESVWQIITAWPSDQSWIDRHTRTMRQRS